MEETFSLVDLLSAITRKGKKILIIGVIFAVLLGGYKGILAFTQIGTAAGNPAISDIFKVRYEEEKEYIENSILMQIDPNNEVRTTVSFAITGLSPAQAPFVSASGIDPRITALMVQYCTYFNGLDLCSILESEQPSVYLSEIVQMVITKESVLQLQVIGADPDEAETMAKKALDAVSEFVPTVTEALGQHELTVVSFLTSRIVDKDLAEYQKNHFTTLDNNKKQMESAGSSETMTLSGAFKSAIKWALIGLFGGILLGCVWVWIKSAFTARMETSAQIEDRTGLKFAGNLRTKRNLFEKAADKLSGEKAWKVADEAAAYCRHKVELAGGKGKLVVLSSIALSEEDRKAISSAFGKELSVAEVVCDAVHSVRAMEALPQADGVLFAERLGKSKTAEMQELIRLAKDAEKPVYGFILV